MQHSRGCKIAIANGGYARFVRARLACCVVCDYKYKNAFIVKTDVYQL
jgi:hypothetical protein